MLSPLLGLALSLLLSVDADAGDRKEARRAARADQKSQDIDPEISTDYTAFTVDRGQWRMGLVNFDYGLTDEVQLRTSPAAWLLGPNVAAKLRVAEFGPVQLSLGSGIYSVNLARAAEEDSVDATFQLIPVEWKGSWTIRGRWGLHFGTQHRVVKLSGGLTGDDIGDIMGSLTGDDAVGEQLDQLGAGLYGDAQIWQHQTRFALDFQINRRGSVMLLSNNTFLLNGLVTAGASTTDAASGTTTEIGASARVSSTLDNLPSAVSANYQWSWPRFHLRVGLPLTPGNPLVFTQIVNFYWVLGPKDAGAGSPSAPPPS